jgi:hypothetical protein
VNVGISELEEHEGLADGLEACGLSREFATADVVGATTDSTLIDREVPSSKRSVIAPRCDPGLRELKSGCTIMRTG